MSSRELAEAGVLGLDPLPAESDSVWESKSTASACEVKTSDDLYNKMIPEVDPQVSHSNSDLLTELRQVHALDEMIVEEKLKIHIFRQKEKPDEELPRSKTEDSNRLSVRKEREAFRLQLEKEKLEVDILEKSLENECKGKKQKDRSKKVIRCSIMEKTRPEKKGDEAEWHEDLPGSSNGSHDIHATLLACSDSELKHETEHPEEALNSPIPPENASTNHPIQLPPSQADLLGCEAALLRRNTSNLKPVQPLECELGENPIKPEASLTPELRPDDGAFDPGGNWCVPPLPKPRKVLLAKDEPSEDETPHFTELQIPALSSLTDDVMGETAVHKHPDEEPESSDINHIVILTANEKEHHNHNNQSSAEKYEFPSDCFSQTNIKDEDGTLGVFKGLEEGDLQSVEEMSTLSPRNTCLPPEPPFELQLGGGGHQDVDVSGVQTSEWMKTSGCESAGHEPQHDIAIRPVICGCLYRLKC